MPPTYFVYFMASQKNGTIYIGVSNDLYRRVFEHREKLYAGFSKKHRTTRLVYYEQFADVRDAIYREKQLKKWNRAWKIELIEQMNPDWRDLWFDLNR
jgi:putative endonuclease